MEQHREELNTTEIAEGTSAGLKKYESLGFLERFAMYMGVAQILELRLKQIGVKVFSQDFDSIENLTLGQTLRLLEKEGIRMDFLLLADPVKDARNHIAHDLLADEIILRSVVEVPDNHYTKPARTLDKSIYELEQLMFILEYTDEYGQWKFE